MLVARGAGICGKAAREAWMDKLEANGVQMAATGKDKLFPAPVVEWKSSALRLVTNLRTNVDTRLDAYVPPLGTLIIPTVH